MKHIILIVCIIIMLILIGCCKNELVNSHQFEGVKGNIIARMSNRYNSIYIINLNKKDKTFVKTDSLAITGTPVWGEDGSVYIPTEEGIVKYTIDKKERMTTNTHVVAVRSDKDENRLVYLDGDLNLRIFSLVNRNEEEPTILEDIIGSWISYYQNKIAFQSRGGTTRVFDLQKRCIVDEYTNCDYYTFGPNGEVAYIRTTNITGKEKIVIEYGNRRKELKAPWGKDIVWSPDGRFVFFTSLEWGFPYRKMRANIYDLQKNKLYVFWNGLTSGSLNACDWKY